MLHAKEAKQQCGNATTWRTAFGVVSLTIVSLCSALHAQEQETPLDTAQAAAQDTITADTVQQEVVRAREAAERLVVIGDTIQIMIASGQGASDEERELIRMQALGYLDEVGDLRGELLDLIPQLDSTNAAVDSIIQSFGSFLTLFIGLYDRSIDEFAARLSVLREQRSETAAADLGDLQIDIQEARGRLDTVIAGQMETLVAAEAMRLDIADKWAALDRFVITRVESRVGRLQLADVERDRFRAQLRDAERAGSSESEIASVRARFQLAEQRVAGITASVLATSDLLDRRGIETAQYRRIVIGATGEVTGDILDPAVFVGLVGDAVAGAWSWIGMRGPTILARLFIIIGFIALFRIGFRIGWWAVLKFRKISLPRLLRDMIGRMLRPVATILGLFAALWFLGVNPTTLVAGLGVAGIIVGLALQDSMSNLAAGFFILIYRPYDMEDVVSAGGVVGTVKEMGLANTTIVTFDNRRLFVPNQKIWSEIIENRSAEPVRRVETTVKISYQEDLERVFGILKGILKAHDKVLDHPEGSVFVSDLADSWIEVRIWSWAANKDWWSLSTDLPRAIRLGFQAEGIEVPYPRQIEEHITPSGSQVSPP